MSPVRGGVRRAGRQVQDIAGRERHLAEAVDLPPLGPVDLEHQHIVVIRMAAQAGGRRRAEIRVGLHGVGQLLLHVDAEPSQRRPGALQPLEHDRRPAGDEGQDPIDVSDIVDHDRPDVRTGRERRHREGRAVVNHAKRWTSAEIGEHHFDRVDVEEIGEVVNGLAEDRAPPPAAASEVVDVADAAAERGHRRSCPQVGGCGWQAAGSHGIMSNLSDDDITSESPTEDDENRDTGAGHGQDTGDEPTERDDDLDQGGEGDQDTGDELLSS